MASNYRSCPYTTPNTMQRRARPDSLPTSQIRRPLSKMRPNMKTYSGSQYGAHATPRREELFRAGSYVILKGAQIAGDLYHAVNVFENKTYITKVVQKKDCFKSISHYKSICSCTELPHIHDVVSVNDYTLIVLDLHPYFDQLPAQADQEKVQKYTKEILELVSKLHESGISPQKMSIDDFTRYKDTPTSVGYHLQMMKLDGSLMLNEFDEEFDGVDPHSSPELVNLFLNQKNTASKADSCGSVLNASISKLEAMRNGLDLEKADSWRVGAMLYTMLAGKAPFPDPVNETQGFFDAIYNSQLKTPTKKTTRNAWEFLLGLLEPDPEERLSISQALEHPWLQEYALRTESHGMLSSKEEHKLPSSNPSSPVL